MGVKHKVIASLPAGRVTGKVAGSDWTDDHDHVPFQTLLFHAGPTGLYTAPTAATVLTELPNAPMSRIYTDLNAATQARFTVGQRVIGAGYTTAILKLQYATVAQSTWTDLAAVANAGDLSLLGGTANSMKVTPWFNIAAAALATDQVLRCVIVTTGTGSTAASVSFASVLFR